MPYFMKPVTLPKGIARIESFEGIVVTSSCAYYVILLSYSLAEAVAGLVNIIVAALKIDTN